MIREFATAIRLALATMLIGGLAYPLGILMFASSFVSQQRLGLLIRGPHGAPVGSRLIAQPFERPEYFWPRPSAVGYDAAASGSGLDPHISLAGALVQVPRLANRRGRSENEIRQLVERFAQYNAPSFLGGEPLINVLLLNLALDELFPVP